METSKKQTLLFTEDKSTFSQGDSPANHTPSQAREKVKTMIDTSGRKCLEQYEKLNPGTSWAKTFVGSLVGMKDWFSTRCNLTWKMKASKSSRLYFQLQASTPRTKETEFGLLLKTPCASDSYTENLSKKEQKWGNSGTLAQEIATGFIEKRGIVLPTPLARDWKGDRKLTNGKNVTKKGEEMALTLEQRARVLAQMLPTPTAYDWNSARKPETFEKAKARHKAKGVNLQMPLKQMARNGMLPTPRTTDVEGGKASGVKNDGNGWYRENKKGERWGVKLRDVAENGLLPTPKVQDERHALRDRGKSNLGEEMAEIGYQRLGTTSHLNPLFCAEMMGFPVNWTVLPFLNGEKNQSKDTETP